MAEAELDQSLLSFESEAKRLADASKKTNTIIQAVQARLQAAKIGLEYWLERKPLAVEMASGERASIWLGFAKIENEWQIAVKAPPGTGTLARFVANPPVPLIKSSRETRQVALPLLAELIDGLKSKVAQKADALESVARHFEQ